MKKSKLTAMIEIIKAIFVRSNGVLLLNKQEIPNELNDYYTDVVNDLEMKSLSEDKKNMKIDGSNLKKDIKKAVSAYRSELVNG